MVQVLLRLRRLFSETNSALLALPLLLPLAPTAHAQLLDQLITTDIPGTANEAGVTVLSRRRPDYDSLGMRFGSFLLHPELRESVGYDDNILGTKSGSGSTLVETNAVLRADYDHSDATARAVVSVDDFRFVSRNSQSYTNWTASVGGAYTIDRDQLSASYDHLTLNQTPRDLEAPQLGSPLEYRIDVFRAAYKAMFNRWYLQPGISLSRFDYDNGGVNGARYLQTFRNRDVAMPSLTVGYELAPRRNVVLVVRDAVADYSNAAQLQAKRNFNDASVLAGIDYDADSTWRFRVLAGYENRSFRSGQYKTIQAPTVETAVIWNPNGLTTLTGLLTRHVQDSADETVAAFTETALIARIDHELQRNILLQGRAGIYQDDYSQGHGSQSLYRVGASATWLINRNLQLVGSYDFTGRRSGGSTSQGVTGPSFDSNRFMLTLRVAL